MKGGAAVREQYVIYCQSKSILVVPMMHRNLADSLIVKSLWVVIMWRHCVFPVRHRHLRTQQGRLRILRGIAVSGLGNHAKTHALHGAGV